MSLLCPQCAHSNPDQSTFCIRCGSRLPSSGQSFSAGPIAGSSFPPYAVGAAASSGPPAYTPPSNPPPSYNQPPGSSYGSYVPASPAAYPAQIGASQGQVSIRRAFAGYGTLVIHHSWLVSGGSEQATNARNTILDILRQRNIPGLNVNPQKLMERGVLMEERDYLVARRGVSTIFVYTAPAGNDLYISRATTVLPVISNVRVIVLCLAILIMIIGLVARPGASPYGGFGVDVIGLLVGSLLSFLSAIILFILVIALIRSIIYWIIEKDFRVLLRPNQLNDFQLDDIMLLEHVTDNTIKTAVKQVGLDANQITTPSSGYQPKRRIRTI